MKFIGLDIGKKRIGVATCDKLEVAASPHSVVMAGKNAVESVVRLIETQGAVGVVIGMPFSMDGSQREACEMVQRFISKLEPEVKIPIFTVDERLTTKIAEFSLIEVGMRREKRRDVRDAVSAALILKTFLDGRRTKGETP